MTCKTFFFKSLKTDFQIKYFLANNLFSKFLIRKHFKPRLSFSSLKSVFIGDTNNLFFFKPLIHSNVGDVLFHNKVICSHNTFKKLKLESFIFTENYSVKAKTSSLFLNSVKTLSFLKIPQLTSIIKAYRGGYLVFGKGLTGFLPKSHYRNFLLKNFKIYDFKSFLFLKTTKLKVSTLKFVKRFLDFFFIPKMFCFINKVRFYVFYKKRKLKVRIRKKAYRFKKPKLSFSLKYIFLSPFMENKVISKQLKTSFKSHKHRDLISK